MMDRLVRVCAVTYDLGVDWSATQEGDTMPRMLLECTVTGVTSREFKNDDGTVRNTVGVEIEFVDSAVIYVDPGDARLAGLRDSVGKQVKLPVTQSKSGALRLA